MLLLKGFFRNRTTKIYLAIFTFLIISINIILSISQGYKYNTTKIYQDNSYFLITSNDNIDKLLSDYKDIDVYHKVSLINSDDVFIDDGTKNVSLLVDQDSNFVIAYQSDKILQDNQIYIELPSFVLNNLSEVSDLSKVTINFENASAEFDIMETIDSKFSRIVVSENMFNKLLEEKSYGYVFNIKDYSKKNEIISDFNSKDKVEVNFFQYFDSTTQLDTLESLEKTIDILYKICDLIIVIFCIIFVATMYNVVTDESKKMRMEMLLGYSKRKIKKSILLKIFMMDLFLLLVTIISVVLIKLITLFFFKINITIWNFHIIYIESFIFLISVFMCCLYKIKYY